MKKQPKYYVRDTGDAKEQLSNGSFIRITYYYSKQMLARYVMGDYDIMLKEVPRGYTEVPCESAKALLPKCCK